MFQRFIGCVTIQMRYLDGILQHLLKIDREKWLITFLEEFAFEKELQVGYEYYDSKNGALDLLDHPNYHPQWKDLAVRLK